MNSLHSAFRSWRLLISRIFSESFRGPQENYELCLAVNPPTRGLTETSSPSLLDSFLGDGFLWAVPKKRRSIEKRMTRRMGITKMLVPKTNIVVCDACGHFHPVHTVCGNCYDRVRQETAVMQKAVFNAWKLDPVDREVQIVYENDAKEQRRVDGQRIVELPKERPAWFSQNLLQRDSKIPRKRTHPVGETSFSFEVKEKKL